MASQNKGGGSRKIGRHARVVVKDTFLRDESGNLMGHKAFVARLLAAAPTMHGTPSKKPR